MAMQELQQSTGREQESVRDSVTVAVVIPSFNQARYLGEAIRSVLAQTRPADEIVVVDDGSTDDPASVVAQFRNVRLVRQDNRGPSAARNTGLKSCNASHIVFLDADDRLLPRAIEAGIDCFSRRPDCAFVYGGYRMMSADGRPSSPDSVMSVEGDQHLALLRRNHIVLPAAVMFRCDRLRAAGGYDESLRRAEDFELYLRLAQKCPIAGHREVVAEYRKHDANASNNHAAQLKAALQVLDSHARRIPGDVLSSEAIQAGRARVTDFRVSQMLFAASSHWREQHDVKRLALDVITALRWSPSIVMRRALRICARATITILPRFAVRWIERGTGRFFPISTGSVSLGDLGRTSPISRSFGSERGKPIDRFYIEAFLARHAADIRGRVLELLDDSYTRRFGGGRVTQSDVLSVEANNTSATIVGDLQRADTLPEAAFDCVIFTQALQYLFDLRAGLVTLHRALKPGGVLLVTAPGLTPSDQTAWPWYWSFNASALRRLLDEQFGSGAAEVESRGNVLIATKFLYGLALEECSAAELKDDDPAYPVIVTARVVKRALP